MAKNLRPQAQWIVNSNGERTAVILDIKVYELLVEAFEQAEDIRAYNEAKAEGDEFVPLEEAWPSRVRAV